MYQTKKIAVLVFGLTSLLLVTSVQAQTLEQRVERLERMADNPVLIQHSQRMAQQEREIQSLHGQMDHLLLKIDTLQKQLSQNYVDMDERINKLEAGLRVSPSTAGQTPVVVPAEISTSATQTEITPVKESASPGLTEQERYDAAFTLLRESHFDEAITAFKAFVKDYPATSLTSNAFYWLGEAYMIKQDFTQAYDAFNTVIQKFDKSNKISDSLLRGADSLVGLNRLDEAKAMYQDLIKRDPNSRSARTAERRLERFKAQ